MEPPQTLGLTASTEPTPSKRLAGITQGLLVGGSMAGGGTVVFGAIELIRSEPDKAFRLLESWGPWFFLALFIAWALTKLGNRLLDVVERLGDRMADAMENVAGEQKNQAEAMKEQALALQAQASKDDRERERLSTMVDYGAQQSRQALETVQALSLMLSTIGAQVQKLVDKGS